MFILKHNFTSELSAGVYDALSNVYPDKKALNKTIHKLTTI
jgi:hypothetical protein